jgi:NADH dehydrogenase [ubiquinone] 1 alpha subcomplex assembly factor 6
MNISFARKHCLGVLKHQDKSSFILQSYYKPEAVNDAYLAVKCFDIELSKVSNRLIGTNNAQEQHIINLRFEFWKSLVLNASSTETSKEFSEPISILLNNAYENSIQLSRRYFLTMIQTRQQPLQTFRTIDSMCSYGEGTYSQINYLNQEIMYSQIPSMVKYMSDHEELQTLVSNMAAHVGQANGVAAFLRGFEYFVKSKNFIPLPVDVMAKHNVSQEVVLRNEASASIPGLSECVFEVATRANDHLLTLNSLLQEFKQLTGSKLTPSLFIPLMSAVPVRLYLERLEKYNFDIFNKKLQKNEWRLPYRSYKAYKLREI